MANVDRRQIGVDVRRYRSFDERKVAEAPVESDHQWRRGIEQIESYGGRTSVEVLHDEGP